jgi:hypothetical protein
MGGDGKFLFKVFPKLLVHQNCYFHDTLTDMHLGNIFLQMVFSESMQQKV